MSEKPADESRSVESASLDAIVRDLRPLVRIGATPAQMRQFAKSVRNAVVVEVLKRQDKNLMSSHYEKDGRKED